MSQKFQADGRTMAAPGNATVAGRLRNAQPPVVASLAQERRVGPIAPRMPARPVNLERRAVFARIAVV